MLTRVETWPGQFRHIFLHSRVANGIQFIKQIYQLILTSPFYCRATIKASSGRGRKRLDRSAHLALPSERENAFRLFAYNSENQIFRLMEILMFPQTMIHYDGFKYPQHSRAQKHFFEVIMSNIVLGEHGNLHFI